MEHNVRAILIPAETNGRIVSLWLESDPPYLINDDKAYMKMAYGKPVNTKATVVVYYAGSLEAAK